MGKFFTKEEIIKSLKALPKDKPISHIQLIKYYNQGLFLCHMATVCKKFGSIKKACEIAGVKFSYYNNERLSDEEILNQLKRLPQDKPINEKQLKIYNKQGLICGIGTLYRHFGSPRNACKKAGIRCDYQYGNKLNYTKKEVIDGLKYISKKYGKFKPTELNSLLKKEKLFTKDVVVKHFGGIRKALKELNISHKNRYWSNKRILNKLANLYDKYGKFNKVDVDDLFSKSGQLCSTVTIRNRFGSLDKAAEYAGIDFKNHKFICPNIGRNEKELLDNIEANNNVKLIRQHRVGRYYIDGYDPINNIAYEVDEQHHSRIENQIYDIKRENNIKEKLGCNFVRIEDC